MIQEEMSRKIIKIDLHYWHKNIVFHYISTRHVRSKKIRVSFCNKHADISGENIFHSDVFRK